MNIFDKVREVILARSPEPWCLLDDLNYGWFVQSQGRPRNYSLVATVEGGEENGRFIALMGACANEFLAVAEAARACRIIGGMAVLYSGPEVRRLDEAVRALEKALEKALKSRLAP